MWRLPDTFSRCRLHISPHGVRVGRRFMTSKPAPHGAPDDRAAGRSDQVLGAICRLTAELGRGPTVTEIVDHLADGRGDVRAELGALLGGGLVACRGLAEAGLAPCWVAVSP